MKRSIMVFLAVLLAFTLLLGGCSQPAPSTPAAPPAPSTTGEAEEAPHTDPEQVFHLTYCDWGPEQINTGQAAVKAIKMIEERTGGKVIITPYFSETLLKFEDTFSGVANGVADMSLYVSTFSTGIHDLNLIFHRLFPEEAPDNRGLSRVYQELLKNVPEIQEEMERTGVRWLNVYALVGSDFHTSKKPCKVPADIKGMKVQAYGDTARMVEDMGGASIEVPPNDWYMGFERGLFEGQFMHWPGIESFKLLELVRYHTMFGKGGITSSGIGTLINLDTWNSLPPDIQEIITEAFEEVSEELIEDNIRQIEDMTKQAQEQNNTFIELTAEEIAAWVEYINPINEEWIENTEAKGWPARETYEYMMSLFREYR